MTSEEKKERQNKQQKKWKGKTFDDFKKVQKRWPIWQLRLRKEGVVCFEVQKNGERIHRPQCFGITPSDANVWASCLFSTKLSSTQPFSMASTFCSLHATCTWWTTKVTHGNTTRTWCIKNSCMASLFCSPHTQKKTNANVNYYPD